MRLPKALELNWTEGNILVARARQSHWITQQENGSSIVSSRSCLQKIAALNGLRESSCLSRRRLHYIQGNSRSIGKSTKTLNSMVTPLWQSQFSQKVWFCQSWAGNDGRIPDIDSCLDEDELKYIQSWFPAMNHSLAQQCIKNICGGNRQSPFNAGFLSFDCRAKSIIYVGSKKSISLSDKKLEGILREVAESIGTNIRQWREA